MITVYVDAEGSVRSWINANPVLTDPADPARPLMRGAHLNRLDSVHTSYAYLIGVGTTTGLLNEHPVMIARVSATIFAGTKALAERGARALANELGVLQLNATPVRMGDALCLLVDDITGPLPVDQTDTTREQYQYLVDADYYLTST
jgi:hypothetical protein